MDKRIIETCQNFLTVDHGDCQHKIVNLELVMHRHTPENVLSFLRNLAADYDRHLKRHILKDKTDPRINEIVARRFRVKMALRTLQNAMARDAA